MLKRRIVPLIVGCLLASFAILGNPAIASASLADCTGTPLNPVQSHNSSTIVASIRNNTIEFGNQLHPLRVGWYCVPADSQGDDEKEYATGVGFGLIKIQDRHRLGDSPPWTLEESIRAISMVISSPNVEDKHDGWGSGFKMTTWTSSREGCTYGNPSAGCNSTHDYMKVIGAVTIDGADFEPRGGMPAGSPLGVQTVYCSETPDGDENPVNLRCPSYVTGDLVEFSYEPEYADRFN